MICPLRHKDIMAGWYKKELLTAGISEALLYKKLNNNKSFFAFLL